MQNLLEIVLPLAGMLGVMIGIVLFLGILIESLVEAVLEPVFRFWPKLEKFKPAQMYIAVALGLIAAFLFSLDLIYLVGMFLSQIMAVEANPIHITTFGIILTGFCIGKGSNFIHQLIMKWAPPKKPILTPPDEHSVQSYG